MGRRRAAFCLLLALAAGCSPDAREAPSHGRVTLAGYAPATAADLRADGWRTDLDRREVALESIARSPRVEREAFVPVRDPEYVTAAATELPAEEPVLVVAPASPDGPVRAWPLRELLHRELVLTEAAGRPIVVTFCSLCGTARAWVRRLGDDALDLAVSGLLLEGNALLWDAATESLWRQDDGACVVGTHVGETLVEVPSFTLSFGALRRARPDAEVMRPPEPSPPPPFEVFAAGHVASGELPPWMSVACARPLEPLLSLPGGPIPVAGPVVEHLDDVVVLRDPGCALPYRDADGRAAPVTGSAAAFRRVVDGQRLTFDAAGPGVFTDRETGSRWNLLGEATDGPLAGRRLEPAAARSGFRFALAE